MRTCCYFIITVIDVSVGQQGGMLVDMTTDEGDVADSEEGIPGEGT